MKHLTVNLLNAYKKRVADKGRVSLITYLKYDRGFEGEFKVARDLVMNSRTFTEFGESMEGNALGTCYAELEDGSKVDMLFQRRGIEVKAVAKQPLKGIRRIIIDLGGLE